MSGSEHVHRLATLRSAMARDGLSVWIAPRADEHQLAYVPPHAERLPWLTGFTGSAGLALVGSERAALFVDGRYTLQARDQTEAALWEQHHVTRSPPDAWLERNVGPGARVGYDPRLHTLDGLRAIRAAVQRAGGVMQPSTNLIDEVWTDRPAPGAAPVELFPDALAGETRAQKRQRIAERLRDGSLDALVITAPENLVWMLNIRGGDLAMTPLVLGVAVLRRDGTLVACIDGKKLGPDVRAALAADGVTLREPAELASILAGLTGRVRVDQATGSEWIVRQLEQAGATPDVGADPCTPVKAAKTAAQVAGMRAAHVRDGVALVRLLAWLDAHAPGGETEWSVSQRLAALRAEGEHYRGPSFSTIAAAGPSSAHCHYSLQEASAQPLASGTLLLVDSGGQYLDGTTDVTRTVIVGTPTEEMRRRYTQVLKGHLALGGARFPQGTTGGQLDILARQFLWRDGVDYDHGTGHGVGSFLGVHEGPQGIAKTGTAAELQPNMVLSNEPGYYKADAFGIRIENLVLVAKLEPQPVGAERTVLCFETLTLAPHDRRLIDVTLLTPAEIDEVDRYHARVRDELHGLLDEETARYLGAATAPLLTR